jgi:hypothetical protein
MRVFESSMFGELIGRGFAVTCFVATVAACGEVGETDTAETMSTESPLFFEPAPGLDLWNGATPSNLGPLGTGANIHVCFTVRPHVTPEGTVMCPNQTSANVDCSGNTSDLKRGVPLNVPLVRQKIRTTIERTWVRYANLYFTGWDDCPIQGDRHLETDPSLRGKIMIAIQQHFFPPPNQACTTHEFCSSTTPNAFCNNGFCEMGGVDFVNIVGRDTTRATVIQQSWSYLLQPEPGTAGVGATIHEMGHALGFHHEWRRSDFSDPNCTRSDVRTVSGGLLLTDFADQDSIMNYCGSQRPDDGSISPGDILGVQRAYGRKTKGSLVGFGGMCANINGGFTTNGTPIIAFPCNNTFNDLWSRESTSQRFRADMGGGVQRCINVNGNVSSTPTPVVSRSCDSTNNQKFPLTNVEWRGMGNLCAEPGPNNSITMKPCNGTNGQKWTFMGGDGVRRFDQIRSISVGKCVQAGTTNGFVGDSLTLVTCSSTQVKQRFSFPGRGVIAYGNFCMNVSGGLPPPSPATPVVLWDGCGNNPAPYNERFTLVGSMKALGQCLDATNPSQVTVAPCSSTNVNQTWEYYL